MHEFLETGYGAKVRMVERASARNRRPSLIHTRIDVGPFAIDEVAVPGDLEIFNDPLNKVCCLWLTSGRAAGRCDGIAGAAVAGDLMMSAQPDLAHHTHVQDLRHTVVLLDPALVAGVAAGLPSDRAPLPVRFSSFAPVDGASAQRWKATVGFVKNVLLAQDALATALVLGHASRMLAAITLSTFPNTATADPTPHDRTDHRPVLLRRAIEFIESNVTEDIGLADIAEAVHVTPHALQNMFRRHLDTTPLQYLLRVRLHYAHDDLLDANPSRDTVAGIAARWGFMDAKHFEAEHRQTYGQSPQTTRGPLHSGERMALLLRTLWAFHELDYDITRTAAVLAVHRSTVRYRLYHIHKLIGLRPSDPRSMEALRDIANRPHRG